MSEKGGIAMELREAIRIAENEILVNDVFSGYCKYCERDATTQCIENGCKYAIAVDTLVEALLKPTPKTIIAPGRRDKKNTYEFGLIVGTKREREYWENKIKDKIEDIAFKTRLAEGDLEILEKYSINHWNDNFAYVEETVAVKNLRNRINDIKELLKGECIK